MHFEKLTDSTFETLKNRHQTANAEMKPNIK